MEADHIPTPVIRRLPKYLVHVQELRDEGVEWASSQDIADALGLTSSTVRQDLSHMELKGISKKGYEIVQLEAVLRQILGADMLHRMVIIGAGNLGRALAAHGDFGRRGFEICGLFDQEASVIGTAVGTLQVKPMSALPEAEANTINGLLLEELEAIPEGRTCVRIGRHIMTIVDINDNVIGKVLIRTEPEP